MKSIQWITTNIKKMNQNKAVNIRLYMYYTRLGYYCLEPFVLERYMHSHPFECWVAKYYVPITVAYKKQTWKLLSSI